MTAVVQVEQKMVLKPIALFFILIVAVKAQNSEGNNFSPSSSTVAKTTSISSTTTVTPTSTRTTSPTINATFKSINSPTTIAGQSSAISTTSPDKSNRDDKSSAESTTISLKAISLTSTIEVTTDVANSPLDVVPQPPDEDHTCWWRNKAKLATFILGMLLIFGAVVTGCARRKGYCKWCSTYEDIAKQGLATREYQQNAGDTSGFKNDSYEPL